MKYKHYFYDIPKFQYMACNYGPGGNMRGQSIYEQGEPGSKCPTGTTKTAEGLCAQDKKQKTKI